MWSLDFGSSKGYQRLLSIFGTKCSVHSVQHTGCNKLSVIHRVHFASERPKELLPQLGRNLHPAKRGIRGELSIDKLISFWPTAAIDRKLESKFWDSKLVQSKLWTPESGVQRYAFLSVIGQFDRISISKQLFWRLQIGAATWRAYVAEKFDH